MVHALHEAGRVLKPNSILIDLRPVHVHRRVGVQRDGDYQPLGVMHEKFDDDLAADRAVAHVLREKLFKVEERMQFNCNRVMDSFEEFKDWLLEFTSLGKLPSHDRLLKRVEGALEGKRGRTRIVVSGPLKLQVLRKQAAR